MPDAKLLFRCPAKGTQSPPERPAYSRAWFQARRAPLEIYDDKIVCGDWVIPVAGIEAARLLSGREIIHRFHILELRAQGRIFQFGVSQKTNLKEQIPFEFDEENIRLKYSAFSVGWRLALIGMTAFAYYMFLA